MYGARGLMLFLDGSSLCISGG